MYLKELFPKENNVFRNTPTMWFTKGKEHVYDARFISGRDLRPTSTAVRIYFCQGWDKAGVLTFCQDRIRVCVNAFKG